MIIPYQSPSQLLNDLSVIALSIEVAFFIWIIARYIQDQILEPTHALPPDRKTPP